MRIINKIKLAVLFTSLILFLAGCWSSQSSQVYSRNQTMQSYNIVTGTVQSVKEIMIEGTQTPVGAVAGGIAGGVLGHSIGGGSGQNIATAVGALAGLAAGSAIEEGITRTKGLEIVVKKDNGKSIVVVQEADVYFYPGERVNIITSQNGTTRISK